MKIKKIILLGSIFICIMIFSACNVNNTVNQNIEEHKAQNEELKFKTVELEKIVQSYKERNSLSEVSDVLHIKELNGSYYIALSSDSDVQLWKYTEDKSVELLAEGIDVDIETREPYLYCTVLSSLENDEYKEEVIKLDGENNKSIIYEGRNVEISASPDGEYFIIIENSQRYLEEEKNTKDRILKILDNNDKIIFDEAIDSKMDTDLYPYGWNDKEFWGLFRLMAGKPEILILNVETLEYDVIENKADHQEFDINMKNGWICYSDFPMFFDIDTYNEFKESKKEINLYLYNIFTDEKINIASSVAEEFSPKWVDEYTFEYTDPGNRERIKNTLKK